MRKVFLTMMLLQKSKPTKYVSDDFSLVDKEYFCPISYIIADSIEENDEFLVITGLELGHGEENQSVKNYHQFQEEVKQIAQEKHAKVSFAELDAKTEFDGLTFNRFFKSVAEKIQEGDVLFADITFGMKPYSFSLFIALAYVVKVCKNVELDTLIYAQKFSGAKDAAKTDESNIFDLTGLFYLNQIASKARGGERETLDEMLNFIIRED